MWPFTGLPLDVNETNNFVIFFLRNRRVKKNSQRYKSNAIKWCVKKEFQWMSYIFLEGKKRFVQKSYDCDVCRVFWPGVVRSVLGKTGGERASWRRRRKKRQRTAPCTLGRVGCVFSSWSQCHWTWSSFLTIFPFHLTKHSLEIFKWNLPIFLITFNAISLFKILFFFVFLPCPSSEFLFLFQSADGWRIKGKKAMTWLYPI